MNLQETKRKTMKELDSCRDKMRQLAMLEQRLIGALAMLAGLEREEAVPEPVNGELEGVTA